MLSPSGSLPRLAQSENAVVTASKTDSFVLLAVAGDVRGVVERLKLKQKIDAPHQVSVDQDVRRRFPHFSQLHGPSVPDPSLFLQKMGYMALHAAVDSGHFEVVRTLLDWGADVNVRRVGSLDTPAHLACSSAGLAPDVAIAMLKYLRSRGADFAATNHVRMRCDCGRRVGRCCVMRFVGNRSANVPWRLR